MRSIGRILVVGLLALQAASQQVPEVGHAKLYTYGELLKQHNIPLTQSALVIALKNADADVRYLAAMKLAEDKRVEEVPAIREALAAETVSRDRVNMALALGLLGDESGVTELKKTYADANVIPEFRLYAIRYVLDLGAPNQGDCLTAAQDIGQSEETPISDRITALQLLVQFRGIRAEESERSLQLLEKSLQDKEPVIRTSASNTLARLGNPSSVASLIAAIGREKDQSVRTVFEADLTKLQGNVPPP